MFGWFKKKTAQPKSASKPAKDLPSLPTVKAEPELFECFAEVFRQEMSTVKPFKARQIEEMLALIETGEGGFLNKAHYHQTIFERYFKCASWYWPEYERWQAIFGAHGSTPINWPQFPDGQTVYGEHLYTLLMRFMDFRAKALHGRQRRAKLGLGEKLLIAHDQDRPFVEMALEMNPDALPPFFPTDVTVLNADMGDLRMKKR